MIMKSMFVILLIFDYLMLLDGSLQPGVTSTVTESNQNCTNNIELYEQATPLFEKPWNLPAAPLAGCGIVWDLRLPKIINEIVQSSWRSRLALKFADYKNQKKDWISKVK